MTPENNLNRYLQNIWSDFVLLNPTADRIHALLKKRGETVVNDHIAFRTFAGSAYSAARMAESFTRFGYTIEKHYQFPEKKLKALHLEHFDVEKPKIFISEIDLSLLSMSAQKILKAVVSKIPESVLQRPDLPFSGRHWQAGWAEYSHLAKESEYAAWVYAHGFRANHFTVSVNALKSLHDIFLLNRFVKENGFTLNEAGGEVKGSPNVFLEQSSTMAAMVQVSFKEGLFPVPGGYYEFAKRYHLENNKLFQGFVADSANKIFESTHRL